MGKSRPLVRVLCLEGLLWAGGGGGCLWLPGHLLPSVSRTCCPWAEPRRCGCSG